ncbi:IucA/IucC family protein [Nocardia sp. NPDC049149]|uniref:IucA/IucC family protein n=1 Tax=Nocardia sp. NPDC049149 TaxID=3364315 RepID=UPI0037188B33
MSAAVSSEVDEHEQYLVFRVLAAMLREDVLGLRTRGTEVVRADGRWVRLGASTEHGVDALLLPVTSDGFLCADTARLPLLVRESDGSELRSVAEIVGALATFAEPADRSGFLGFAAECAQTLATIRLHAATRQQISDALTTSYGDRLDRWTGQATLAFDTLAARHDHPVYPTARARSGLSEGQLRSYTPEFHPRFMLRWLAVPQAAVTVAGGVDFPPYWPTPDRLGAPQLADSHLLLPIHPLTVGAALDAALRELDLHADSVLLDQPYLEVIPTLSTRTVALAADPAEHLKLPLATATLGQRNVRTIKTRTLVDGALCQRLLETVIAREPRFRQTILLADESTYAHAEHELLAVLRRRYPAELDGGVVVPMAALLSMAGADRRVVDHLADRFYDGDPIALFDAWLTLLFDWQTTLFGYGIALESHQQNISLVLDIHDGATRMRMVFKDNDTARVHTERAHARLGGEPPRFTDPRINVDDDRALTDLFSTITMHLCAGSYAFELARLGHAPLSKLLLLVRDRLEQAIGRVGDAERLRAEVLDAPTLPVKAMVSAGTLFSKERSGATDINKHYTAGPNYLRTLGGAQ